MKTTQYIFLICLLSLFVSCKKDPPAEPEPTEPVMPPATQIGANTFGCYIDGELFVANEGGSVWSIPALSGSYDEVDKDFRLQGSRYINDEAGEYDDVRIRADITAGEGIYNYRYNEMSGSDGYVNWHGGCSYYYLAKSDNLGKLTITYLNEDENIIAGTFYINLINPDCEEDTIMKITEGRFDFRY